MSDLTVFLAGEPAGTLTSDADGNVGFDYLPQYLATPAPRPLCLGLPLMDGPQEGAAVRAWVKGLLPGPALREAVCQQRGIPTGDDAALLRAVGGDCPGAVSVGRDRQQGYLEISRPQLADMLGRPPVLPQLTGAGGVRLTLAGSADKLPVYLEGNRIYLPLGGSPSSHLLKLGGPADLAAEVLANRVAQGLGLRVPELALVRLGATSMLVIKRYDRALDQDGQLLRRHQQSFGQALGAAATLARCFTLLADHSLEPALDLEELLRWRVFQELAGEPGAAAADLSLMTTGRGVRLAPYCGLRLGAYRLVAPDTWRHLAEQVGVKERYVAGLARRLVASLEPARAEAVAELEQQYGPLPGVE